MPLLSTLAILQSFRRNPVGLFVRGGRALYIGSAGMLTLAMYTAYKNQADGRSFLEAFQKGLDVSKASKSVSSSNGTNGKQTSGSTGSGINGDSLTEPFSERRYNARLQAITVAGRAFGVAVTSGVRTSAQNDASNGVAGSLHLHENGGLAFDLSSGPGPISPNERRFYDWARMRPDLFQEVILHNAGSGWHVHVAFRPDVIHIRSMATTSGTGVQN